MKNMRKLVLPIGLLALAGTSLAALFVNVPDGPGDFLRGFGITLIIASLVIKKLRPTFK